MRFRLLAGSHAQNGPDGKEYTYCAGDILEYPLNLADRWPEKFLRVDDHAQVTERQGRVSLLSTDRKTAEARQSPVHDPYTPMVPRAVPEPQPSSQVAASISKSGAPFPADYDRVLNSMTEKELRSHAADEEIDVSGCADKPSLISTIKAAWQ